MASENNDDIEQAAFTIDQGTFDQKTIFIRSELNHNKVVDLTTNPNNLVNIWDFNGGANQQWEFLYDSLRSAYQIVSVDTGEALNNTAAGKLFMDRPNSGSSYNPMGYWQLRKIDNTDYYVIWNLGSSLVLDLTNSNTTNGTLIQTYYQINSTAQFWYLG